MLEERKPKGSELNFAKTLQKASLVLDAGKPACIRSSMASPLIGSGHAIEGVRTNARGRKCGILRALGALEKVAGTTRHDAEEVTKFAERVQNVAEDFRRSFDRRYKICPSCKGSQGEGELCRSWEDCANCAGNGFLKR